jgi:hypothetical protein
MKNLAIGYEQGHSSAPDLGAAVGQAVAFPAELRRAAAFSVGFTAAGSPDCALETRRP